MEIIVDIKNTAEKLSSLNEKFDRLVTESFPKIKESVKKLNTAHNATRARLDKLTSEATADIGELKERCTKFEDDLSSHINNCGEISNHHYDEFSSASTIINQIEDRKRRENNLIILNVPEQIKNGNVRLTRDYDLKKVKLALDKINHLDTRFNLKNIKRISKFNAEKIRPICVKCDSRYDVTSWNFGCRNWSKQLLYL